MASGAPICDPVGPTSCEASPRAAMMLGAPASDSDRPRYATQAVVDCRAPSVRIPIDPALLAGLVGECDGTPRDAWYRASRDPDSERATNGLRPARRDGQGASTLAACAGVPSEGGDASSGPAPSQPVALFALPALPPVSATRLAAERSISLLTRQPRPLERPPRT
ncbi:MAG TPA: hypothetical protein VFH68_08795 [Polyangia bacterium]|nr:hypothetical protein [Polyangia bacterium]